MVFLNFLRTSSILLFQYFIQSSFVKNNQIKQGDRPKIQTNIYDKF